MKEKQVSFPVKYFNQFKSEAFHETVPLNYNIIQGQQCCTMGSFAAKKKKFSGKKKIGY